MVWLYILFSIIFFICFVESIPKGGKGGPDGNRKPITIPFYLRNGREYFDLLKRAGAGIEPNATLLSQSPRKNNLIQSPTSVKVTPKMERIEEFNEEKHELKIDFTIDYKWADERLKTNKSLRLLFTEGILDSDSSIFWIPKFVFIGASATPKYAKYMPFKNEVYILKSYPD